MTMAGGAHFIVGGVGDRQLHSAHDTQIRDIHIDHFLGVDVGRPTGRQNIDPPPSNREDRHPDGDSYRYLENLIQGS